MLIESEALFDSIFSSAAYQTRSHVVTLSRSQVVAEICACVDRPKDRRKTVKDSQEQWFVVGGVRPS